MMSASDQVHLLVGKLAYKLPDGTTQLGQCSNFLCTRQTGDQVRFHILKVCSWTLLALPLWTVATPGLPNQDAMLTRPL